MNPSVTTTSTAVAMANLDIFEREGLNQNVLDNEAWLRERGINVIEPDVGPLASRGEYGRGLVLQIDEVSFDCVRRQFTELGEVGAQKIVNDIRAKESQS